MSVLAGERFTRGAQGTAILFGSGTVLCSFLDSHIHEEGLHELSSDSLYSPVKSQESIQNPGRYLVVQEAWLCLK